MMKDIEQAVLDIIERIYCAKYVGKLSVKQWAHGYSLTLGLNNTERPIYIMGEGTEEEFLKLVEKELKFMGLDRTKYFFGVKIYENEDEC